MAELDPPRLRLATGNLGQVGGYNPQRFQAERAQAEDNVALQALSGLLQIGEGIAKEKFASDVKQEYMQGQRARMLGQALEDVEGDPLARPFIRGGFQDQDYRIRQAEMSQRVQAFIQSKGRMLPPEQFLQELGRESRAILEGMGDGLSNQGRAQALASQTQLEEALVSAHAKAYKAWGIEEAGKRISAQGNSILTSYGKAKLSGDFEAQQQYASQIVGFYRDVATSDTLPEDMRQKVAEQFLMGVLSEDHREVVTAMKDMGLLDTLGFDTRAKVNEGIRASESRTRALDAVGTSRSAAEFEARVEQGSITPEDMLLYTAQEAAAGRMTANQQKALWDKWYTSKSNKQALVGALDALQRGDKQALDNLGWSVPQALDAWYEQADLQQMPVATKAAAALRMGTRLGTIPKRAATEVNAAVRSLTLNPDAANPAQVELVRAFVDESIRVSTTNPAGESTLLSALDREIQPLFSQMLVDVPNGTDPVQSLRNAALAQAAYEKLDQPSRQAQTRKLEEAVQSEIQTGKFAQLWGLVTEGSRTRNEGQAFETLRSQTTMEAAALARQPQYAGLSPSALAKLATARVQERTIEVSPKGSKTTRVVLPRNVALERLVDNPRATKDRVSAALVGLYPPSAKGFQREFYTDGAGVWTTEVDSDGVPAEPELVNWRRVSQQIDKQIDETVGKANRAYAGEVVKHGDVELSISGRTSTSIRPDAVLQWRRDLVQQEGIHLTAYKDRNGVAVGVGENVTGRMKVGDTITREEAELAFLDSSDKALLEGERIAKELGVTAVWSKLALGSAVYQLGPQGARGFEKTFEAIRNKDFDTFEKQVRKSKWYKQTPDRAEYFITKMKGHFYGN
jgi:GH24 family phage-related lysozyme (muramidase)